VSSCFSSSGVNHPRRLGRWRARSRRIQRNQSNSYTGPLNRSRLSSRTLPRIEPLRGGIVWKGDNDALAWVYFSALESSPVVLQGFWTCAGDDVQVVAQQYFEVLRLEAFPTRRPPQFWSAAMPGGLTKAPQTPR
jgi:hypothetical protein